MSAFSLYHLEVFWQQRQASFPVVFLQTKQPFHGGFFTFLSMGGLQHRSYGFHLITRCNREIISVKVYCTPMITGIWKDLQYCFRHTKIFVANDESDSCKAAFFEPYKKGTPAFLILFHAFGSANDLAAAVIADSDRNKNGDILDLTAPTSFQIYTIYIDIWISAG